MASKDIIIALSARRYAQKGDYFFAASVLDPSFLEFLNSANYSPEQTERFLKYSASFAGLDFASLVSKCDKDKVTLCFENSELYQFTVLHFVNNDLKKFRNFVKSLQTLLIDNGFQILVLGPDQIKTIPTLQNLDCKKLLRASILDHLIGKFRRK